VKRKLINLLLLSAFSLFGGAFLSADTTTSSIRRRPGVPYDYTTIKSASVGVKVVRYVKDSLNVWRLPQFKDTAKIEYPAIPKQVYIQGRVVLVLTINRNGEVIQSRQVSSSGNSGLDESAQVGVTKIRFAPPQRRKGSGIMGFPYEVMVVVTYTLTFNHEILR